VRQASRRRRGLPESGPRREPQRAREDAVSLYVETRDLVPLSLRLYVGFLQD